MYYRECLKHARIHDGTPLLSSACSWQDDARDKVHLARNQVAGIEADKVKTRNFIKLFYTNTILNMELLLARLQRRVHRTV